MVDSVDKRLHDAADLFKARNAAYGANYLLVGAVCHAMFPEGLVVDSAEKWTRVFLFIHRMTKETRYASNMAKGRGHTDSMEDLSVYSIMANETDEMAFHLKEVQEDSANPRQDLVTKKDLHITEVLYQFGGVTYKALQELQTYISQPIRVINKVVIASGTRLTEAEITYLLSDIEAPVEEPADRGPDEWRR